MTYTTSDSVKSISESVYALDVDQKLALLWFIYTEMGESITPAAPGASTASPAVAEALFDQVKGMSREEQLQLQRDIVSGNDTQITREYGALSDTTKLLLWYLLAQGMDQGSVIPMPSDYKLSAEAENCLNQIKGLEFTQQITLLREIVSPMGYDATSS